MSFVFRLSATLAASLALVASANSQSPPASQPTAISNVRLVNDVDAPRVSILLRNGRIVKVLDAGMDLPAAYRQIDGEGGLALPAFIDGFSTAGVSTPAPVSKKDAMSELDGNVHAGMREANRKGLQPALDVLTVLELSESDLEGYREQGFAAVHSNASGEILAGQSCVVSLADGALRDRVVASEIYQAAALRASGDGYPSTLMGYLSHLRQFFLDARRHALRLNRYGKQNTDRRPPHDPDLESMSAIFGHKQRIVCHADSARDIRRWMKFAKAQDVQIAISGGREAWMVAAELAEAKIPVFLSLDWGDEVDDPDEDEEADEEAEGDEEASADETSGEPEEEVVVVEVESDEFQAKDLEPSATEPGDEEDAEEKDKAVNWKYEEPVGIQRERRRKWEERRDCAIRLNESGVIFVLGTIGESPKDLLKNVRKLVELGLPDDVALAAMTRRVSLVLGIEERVGKLEAGHDANVAIWSASPFAKKANLEWLFIDGSTFEFEPEEESTGAPAEGVELSGEWEVSYEDQDGKPALLTLEMTEAGEVTGVFAFEAPDGSKSTSDMTGSVSGHDLTLSGSIEMGQFSAKLRIEGQVDHDSLVGDATWKFSGGEDSNSFKAKRKPNWQGKHTHGTPF